MCVSMYVYVCVCVHEWVFPLKYVYMYMCMYMCMYMSVYVCIFVCICMYVYHQARAGRRSQPKPSEFLLFDKWVWDPGSFTSAAPSFMKFRWNGAELTAHGIEFPSGPGQLLAGPA